MSNSIEGKVVFITGAGRGMGTDIAKAALVAGCKVVATGRNTKKGDGSHRRIRRPVGCKVGRHQPF